MTAPSAPATAPDMQTASDTGSSNTDDITSDTTPTFDVSCSVAGFQITLLVDGVARGSHTCAGVGIESATVSPAITTDGVYLLTYTETDFSGNTSVASSSLSVTIDTTAPSAPSSAPDLDASSDTGSSNTDNDTSDTTPTFSGTCTTGELVKLYKDGVFTSGDSFTCVAGVYTITLGSAAADGTFSFTTTFTDLAGNEGPASPSISVVIDTTPDAAPGAPDMTAASDTGSSNTDDNTSDTTPSFTMTCATGSIVTLYDNLTQIGSGTCAGSTVTITASVLTDGVYTSIRSRQTDTAGNVSPYSTDLTVTIDSTNPAVTSAVDLDSSSDTGSSNTDDNTSDTTPSFTMTCETGATVSLTDGTNTYTGLCAGGTVTITVSPAITDGTYNYTVTQTDTAGNTSTSVGPLTVIIDSTPPVSTGPVDLDILSDTGSSSSDDLTIDTTPSFTLTCES